MNKTVIAGLVLGVVMTAGSVKAGDEEVAKKLSPEQQAERTALIAKYDANKDGLLDNKEANQMSHADKLALAKSGGVGTAKKGVKGEKVKVEEHGVTVKVKAEAKVGDHTPIRKVEKSGADAMKPTKGKGKK